ncbi:receptor expression-enhancing protein 2-like isoform X1 [Anguilla rostrata]|uniref:receptor expression-enhancing protein 2-like isoform X1 n=2 Tax=Anguilla rostrata TaxID=7938 RepID=UPI0030CC652C
MVSWIISRIVVLAFGTLYPAYSSYKAVKTKNVKEYVKWMMYWIVFAFFTTAETLTDIILYWFPFYFELKIAFVIWLLSPYTKGSSLLYRKFVHPTLSNREQEIDEYITQAKDRSYETMMRYGKRGLNLAATAAVTAASKGQGVLSDKLRSFSMQDLTLIHDEEEEELQLHAADTRLRSSAAGLQDIAEDAGQGGGPAPRTRSTSRPARTTPTAAASDESQHSSKSDADQSEARTEQSDEDTAERPPKRTASVRAKKPAAAKSETQSKIVKKPPKKKTATAAGTPTESA